VNSWRRIMNIVNPESPSLFLYLLPSPSQATLAAATAMRDAGKLPSS